MSNAHIGALALMITLVGAPQASAQMFDGQSFSSPKSHQIEIKFGPYTPGIDDGEGTGAYEKIFGGDSMIMARFEYDYQFWQGFGTLAVGFELGYGSVTGKGVMTGSEDATADETDLNIVPIAVSLVYHFDVLANRWDIPLVPFVKVGLDYNIWWVNNGVGDTSEAVIYNTPGDPTSGGTKFEGAGDTWGWHVAVGLKLRLDGMAPKTAQTFDNEVGVNHSYLFAELLYADISDFGSDKSWQLGDLTGLFGLAFEF